MPRPSRDSPPVRNGSLDPEKHWPNYATLVTPDGRKKYTHAIARPTRQEDGSVLWTGVILDETRTREAIIDARANLRGVFMKSSVDYSWELDATVRTDVKVKPRVGLLAAASVRYLGVDGSLDRGNQTGYVFEGGVRFEGRAGALELFVGGERRIDPYPVEVGTAQWFKAGFRLTGRSSGR